MSKKLKILLAISTLFILSNPTAAQNSFIGTMHTFTMAPGYEMKSYAEAPLIWPSNSIQTIRINVTLSQIPDDISGIVIDALTFSVFTADNDEDVGTQVNYQTQVPQEEINVLDQELSFIESISTPVRGDKFYINITLFARTTGNRTQGESSTYSYRFPVGETIIVSRIDDKVPLINLYGFPPESFFAKWMPIYLIILFITLSPAYVSAYYRIRDRLSKKEVIQNE